MSTRSKALPQRLKYKLNISDLSQRRKKKELFKIINQIDDPHYIEALIIQLEARKEQLEPDFMSYTPKKNKYRGD